LLSSQSKAGNEYKLKALCDVMVGRQRLGIKGNVSKLRVWTVRGRRTLLVAKEVRDLICAKANYDLAMAIYLLCLMNYLKANSQ